MIAYQTNHEGVFVGIVSCDESPLEPGVFIIPGGAVTIKPPGFEEDEYVRWEDGVWVTEKLPETEPTDAEQNDPVDPMAAYESLEKTKKQVESFRRGSYQAEADPLFFKWQAGSATKEEWESARQAVKDAHPYPEMVE
jgi:hypothetical protein